MSRKQKLENKTYDRLLCEGYTLIPPGYGRESLEVLARAISCALVPSKFLVTATPASPDEAQTVSPVVNEVALAPELKRSNARKDKTSKVLLHKLSTLNKKDTHPLADFEIATAHPATDGKYIVHLDTHNVRKRILKDAVESVLMQHFKLNIADIYGHVESLPDHPNRTQILGILKPFAETQDTHPLADFEIKTPVPGKDAQLYMARLGKQKAYNKKLREAVEEVLAVAFEVISLDDIYGIVHGCPEHPNKALILGILKPEEG